MKKIIVGILILFLFISGCIQEPSNKKIDKLIIVTTILPLYSFTKNIVQDKAEVYNIIKPGASEHFWELKPTDIINISKANLYIKNGLGLDDFLDNTVKSIGNKKMIILDSSKNSNLFKNDQIIGFDKDFKDEDHDEGEYDPHIWLSIDNAKKQIDNITTEIINIDPDNKNYYLNNSEKYKEKLANLDNEIFLKLSSVEKKSFIVFHNAYKYYLNKYGLLNYMKAAIEPFPGKEPSQKYIKELIDLIKKNNINIIFSEPQFSPRLVEIINQELGTKIYEINPVGSEISEEDYENNLRNITQSFVNSFDK